ncbi:MAG: DUF1802 family protein [Scytolyngbya sp. HA4215-MV1]|nr:DUF1802 family protein [Scytolyngbya sp. HA4215-MV1]
MTTHALKEWAVAVDALEQGKTILLLRKGGIRERGKSFSVAHRQVLLYPTYEHQQPHLLKAEYAHRVEPVPSGWHPPAVRIIVWAEITHVFRVLERDRVLALLPYHIWTLDFVTERLQWQPDSPLYVLLLRTYRLRQQCIIPYQPKYGGCKSWIDLAESIDLDTANPSLSETEYPDRVTCIRRILEVDGEHNPFQRV